MESARAYLEDQLESLKSVLKNTEEDFERLKDEVGSLQAENIELNKVTNELHSDVRKLTLEKERHQSELDNQVKRISSLEEQLVQLTRTDEANKDKIAELRSLLNESREHNMIQQKTINELQSKVDYLEQDMDDKNKLIDDLRETKETLEDEIDELRKALRGLQNDHNVMLRDKEDVENSYKLINEKTTLMEGTFQTSKGDVRRLTEDVAVLQRRLADAEIENRAYQDKERDLVDQVKSYHAQLSKLESTNEIQSERIMVLEQDVLSLKEEITELLNDRDRAVRELLAVTKEIEERTTHISRLKKELDVVSKEKMAMEVQLEEHANVVSQNETQLLNAERQLQEWMVRGDETDAQPTENIKAERDSLQKEVYVLRQEMATTKTTLDRAQRKKDDLEKENFSLRKQTTELEMKVKALDHENEDLNRELIKDQKRISVLEGDIHRFNVEKNNLLGELEKVRGVLDKQREENMILQREVSELRAIVDNFDKTTEEKNKQIEWYRSTNKNLEEEVTNLKRKIATYREDYDKAQHDVAALTLKVQELESKIDGLQHSLELSDNEKNKLKQEKTTLLTSLNDYKTNFANAKREVDRLQNEILSINRKLTYLQARNETLEEEKDRLKKEITDLKRENTELRARVNALQAERDRLQSDITIINKKYVNIQSTQSDKREKKPTDAATLKRLKDLEESYQRVLNEKEDAERRYLDGKRRISKLELEHGDCNRIIQSLEHELSLKVKRITDLEDSLSELHGRDVVDEGDYKTLRKKMVSLEQELQSSKNKVFRLEAYKTSYEEKLKDLQEDLLASQQKTAQTETMLQASQDQLSAQQKDLLEALKKMADWESAYKSANNAKIELQRTVQTSQSKIISLEEELQNQMKENAQLKGSLDQIRARNDTLREDINHLQKKLIEQQKYYEEQIRELVEKKAIIERLQEENDYLEGDRAELKEELDRVRTELDKTIMEQRDTKFELQKLHIQYTELEGTVRILKDENERLKMELASLQKLYDELKVSREETIAVQSVSTVEASAPDFFSLDLSADYETIKIERDTLKRENNALRDKVSGLDNSLEEVKKERRKLQDKVLELQKTVSERTQEIQILTAENKKVTLELQALRRRFEDLQEEETEWGQERDMLVKEVENMQRKLHDIVLESQKEKVTEVSSEQIFSTMEADFKKLQEREAELQLELLAALKKVSTLEHELETEREKNDGLQGSNRVFEERVTILKREVVEYQTRISKVETDYEHIQERNKELLDHLAELEIQLESVKDSSKLSQQGRSGLENEVISLRTKVKKLQIQVEEDRKIQENLKAQLADYKNVGDNQSRDFAGRVNELRVEIETYRKEIVDKERMVKEMQNKYADLEDDIHKIRRDFQNKQLECDDYIKDLEGSNQQKADMEIEINTLRGQIRNFEIILEEHEKDKSELKLNINEIVSKGTNQSNDLKKQIKDAINQVEVCKREIIEKETIIRELRERVSQTEHQLHITKTELETKENDCEDHIKDLEDTTKEKSGMEVELLALRSKITKLTVHIETERAEKAHFQAQLVDTRNRGDQESTGYAKFVTELQTKVDNTKREISVKEDEIEHLKYEIEVTRRDLLSKDGEFKISLEKIEQITKEKSELTVEIMSLREKVIFLEGDVQKEKIGREGIERQLVDSASKGETDAKFMSEQIIEIQTRVESYKKEIIEKETIIEKLRFQTTSYEQEVDRLKRDFSSKKNECDRYLQDIDRLKHNTSEQLVEINSLRNTINKLEIHITDIRKDKEVVVAQADELKNKGESEASVMYEQIIEIQTRIEEYRTEIIEKETVIEKLRVLVSNNDGEIDKLRRDLDTREVECDGYIREIEKLNQEKYDLEAQNSTIRSKFDVLVKRMDEARADRSLTESETNVLLIKITEIETRIEVYKTEIIEKETLIERLRILNNTNEQDLERLKRELSNKQVECDGYISEIQILNQKLAEIDIELNHRNSRVLKLEGFLDDEKRDKDIQIKNVKSTFEIDFTSLRRELETKILECNGYIKEIEELNQEIFRLKGLLRPEREVEAHYTTSYIMPPKGVTVTREMVVPQESTQTESSSSTFGHTEFMVDVKEKPTKSVEISNYEMSPKRMVKIRSPFEARSQDSTDSSEQSTSTVTTKITRIQRSVSGGADEPSITVVSNNGDMTNNAPPSGPVRITHLESSSSSPKQVNVFLDPTKTSSKPTTLNVADTRRQTTTTTSNTVLTKITQLQTSSVSGSNSSPTLLEFRVQSPRNGLETTTESQGNNKTVISQVESRGPASPIRVKVEAEETLQFEPVQLHVDRKPLQQSSSTRYQTVDTHFSTGGGEGRDGSTSGRTRETSTRTRNVPAELKEQRVGFSRSGSSSGSTSSSRQKGTSKTSEL